ncbi:hydroxymethylglutaryl-CoA reductase [Obelidium mucronatum]|nr:hydroxymethylglutaryl-CoA reductase [Obelidium mucronatum]
MNSTSAAIAETPFTTEGRTSYIPKMPLRGKRTKQAADKRREWLQEFTGASLVELGNWWADDNINVESLKSNIENPIGLIKIPVAAAGPLLFNGEKSTGFIFCPIATTEGALVASITRGASALNKSGGWNNPSEDDPRPSLGIGGPESSPFDEGLSSRKSVSPHSEKWWRTGQNMTTKCTWECTQFIASEIEKYNETATLSNEPTIEVVRFMVEGNISSDKKLSQLNIERGRGISAYARCVLPSEVVWSTLKVNPVDLVEGYKVTKAATNAHLGTHGCSPNCANVIAAVFAACGQLISTVEWIEPCLEYPTGAVQASIVLYCLVIGTVGGGTEVIAGYCLALDLSTSAAIASQQFATAHENMGRNRPKEEAILPASVQVFIMLAAAFAVCFAFIQLRKVLDSESALKAECTDLSVQLDYFKAEVARLRTSGNANHAAQHETRRLHRQVESLEASRSDLANNVSLQNMQLAASNDHCRTLQRQVQLATGNEHRLANEFANAAEVLAAKDFTIADLSQRLEAALGHGEQVKKQLDDFVACVITQRSLSWQSGYSSETAAAQAPIPLVPAAGFTFPLPGVAVAEVPVKELVRRFEGIAVVAPVAIGNTTVPVLALNQVSSRSETETVLLANDPVVLALTELLGGGGPSKQVATAAEPTTASATSNPIVDSDPMAVEEPVALMDEDVEMATAPVKAQRQIFVRRVRPVVPLSLPPDVPAASVAPKLPAARRVPVAPTVPVAPVVPVAVPVPVEQESMLDLLAGVCGIAPAARSSHGGDVQELSF